jgi:hypothetical protein
LLLKFALANGFEREDSLHPRSVKDLAQWRAENARIRGTGAHDHKVHTQEWGEGGVWTYFAPG